MKRADPSRLRRKRPRPLAIRSRAALEAHLSKGGRICKTLPRIESEHPTWTDPATDRTVAKRAVDWAFEQGKLRGCGDGLFGEHQTYERAR